MGFFGEILDEVVGGGNNYERPDPPYVQPPWATRWDDEAGRWLFVNEQTGERSFERPIFEEAAEGFGRAGQHVERRFDDGVQDVEDLPEDAARWTGEAVGAVESVPGRVEYGFDRAEDNVEYGVDRAEDKVEDGWDNTVDAVEDAPEDVAGWVGEGVGKVERVGDGFENFGDEVEGSYDQGRNEESTKFLLPGDDADRGAPQGANTVEAILGADIAGYQCEICDEIGARCRGAACVAAFQAFLAAQQARFLEIRDAGAAMGVGLFATRAVPKDALLCEYTGRLQPIDFAAWPADSAYTWHVAGTCRVDSAVYGNVGRFANHHCTQYNCSTVDVMYGRRKVLCYRARRDIAAGEQVFVNYGTDYFTWQKPCRCSAAEGAHLLGPYSRIRLAPTKKTAWDAKKKQAAKKEKSRQRLRSLETKATKVTKPAKVIARSQL